MNAQHHDNGGLAMQTDTQVRLFEEDYWQQALEVGDQVRASEPVHRTQVGGYLPVWVISRYADARRALTDPHLSKDACLIRPVMERHLHAAGLPTELSGMFRPHMLFQDQPAHGRLRRLLADKFTRTRIEQLRPRVLDLTRGLVDALPADEPFDLVAGLAFPLPLTVIGELTGVATKDHEELRGWTAALMEDDPARLLPASRAMEDYFVELIRSKRARPGDDLLSALLQGSDSDRLDDAELMGTIFLMIVAGHETSTNAITKAARWLMSDTRVWRHLADNPHKIPQAIEEVWRVDSPVRMATHRVTAAPVVYGGVEIPAGEIVLVSLMSANRDPEAFRVPTVFDIERRDARRHLSFGYGMHHCLGAPLGRMEAEIALGELIARFPGARLAVEPQRLRPQRSAIMAGIEELPVLGSRR
ncbi:cytochrome P450 [Saccharothrix longispora]|uniref:cytochrome P450 family protein n=1 Tax=Saccharothrix longispora TaxID=33920 RepID=UPI0028FD80C6|nr:cytochrome P450 [Saccharothrix longispora]MDU0293002.1 cytochrome P450 [Saccharothrix longispora]